MIAAAAVVPRPRGAEAGEATCRETLTTGSRCLICSGSPSPPCFDLDGVVTRTAAVHARAWKELFDSFLAARAGGGALTPFRLPED